MPTLRHLHWKWQMTIHLLNSIPITIINGGANWKFKKKPKRRPLEIEFFLPQTPTSILAPCLQALAVNLLNLQHYARTFSLGTAVDNRVQCNFSVHVWSSLLSIRNSNMIGIRLLRSKTKVDRNKGTKLDDWKTKLDRNSIKKISHFSLWLSTCIELGVSKV